MTSVLVAVTDNILIFINFIINFFNICQHLLFFSVNYTKHLSDFFTSCAIAKLTSWIMDLYDLYGDANSGVAGVFNRRRAGMWFDLGRANSKVQVLPGPVAHRQLSPCVCTKVLHQHILVQVKEVEVVPWGELKDFHIALLSLKTIRYNMSSPWMFSDCTCAIVPFPAFCDVITHPIQNRECRRELQLRFRWNHKSHEIQCHCQSQNRDVRKEHTIVIIKKSLHFFGNTP